MSFHVISCHFILCHNISCRIKSFHVVSSHFMSYQVISCIIVSLCGISKLTKSSNNKILNYRYQNVDSCLTDNSIFEPSVCLRRSPKKWRNCEIKKWKRVFWVHLKWEKKNPLKIRRIRHWMQIGKFWLLYLHFWSGRGSKTAKH
jgi:hypothetical protein